MTNNGAGTFQATTPKTANGRTSSPKTRSNQPAKFPFAAADACPKLSHAPNRLQAALAVFLIVLTAAFGQTGVLQCLCTGLVVLDHLSPVAQAEHPPLRQRFPDRRAVPLTVLFPPFLI